ncbi:plasmid segregation centromere-binding protein ParR [Brasilonema octagenarum UFV-E1]|uniref:Plasmid segregation centromere-binding protein ParR n=1 Tax=Brasilonema sennae CENA114 TaxID=415709 RepID=A0A856MF59_9CYAN|nr:plasmid segregation centromere-binding protein ParR [Brasilonema sennae]QDL08944.1 plasmid segregation centromere-binding protein ParR [Brasilonema sennae CENA114]QDL15299.1 plasmid segregation centromere-binding protein ParR [Brasilonema octagenarum UFV-E1]
MFQWSKKVVKSVTFEPGVADESLLALVESHLEKDPQKTFSDLCKEALWQSLCVPESVRPAPKPAAAAATQGVEQKILEQKILEQKIAALQSQIANLEERFFAKEANRLEMLEQQLIQLSQQVAQLAIMLNNVSTTSPPTPQQVSAIEVINYTSSPNHAAATPSQEVDPVISRISQFLDDF